MAYLREQLDREREARTEERRRQDTIIAQLTQANAALAHRVPELEAPASPAPREAHETPVEESGGVEDQEASGEAQDAPERRSWLYRFFFGVE